MYTNNLIIGLMSYVFEYSIFYIKKLNNINIDINNFANY